MRLGYAADIWSIRLVDIVGTRNDFELVRNNQGGEMTE
jgi:hypothetical protein